MKNRLQRAVFSVKKNNVKRENVTFIQRKVTSVICAYRKKTGINIF